MTTSSAKTLSQWMLEIDTKHPQAIELGLERVRQVFETLDLARPKNIITVAGTNGKGTCVHTLDLLLAHAGQSVARYTSPHIETFNERIVVNNAMVSDTQLVEAFETVEAARQDIPLTFYEFTTLAAFVFFAQSNCDVWLLEVGLGGRLDAVNILDAHISVITSIGFDHQSYLGDSKSQIAFEKAGIMRTDKPCVVGDAKVQASILLHAKTLNSQVYRYMQDFGFYQTHDQVGAQSVVHWFSENHDNQSCLALPDLHPASVACGIQAYQLLTNLPLTAKQWQALANLRLPGRFEQALHQGRTVIFDVAHNVEALQAFCQILQKYLAAKTIPNVDVIMAVSSDKPLLTMLGLVESFCNKLSLAPYPNPRSMRYENLKLMSQSYSGNKQVFVTFDQAWNAVNWHENRPLIVVGSFYTVEAAKLALASQIHCH